MVVLWGCCVCSHRRYLRCARALFFLVPFSAMCRDSLARGPFASAGRGNASTLRSPSGIRASLSFALESMSGIASEPVSSIHGGFLTRKYWFTSALWFDVKTGWPLGFAKKVVSSMKSIRKGSECQREQTVDGGSSRGIFKAT